jgi:hypothetical protein
MVREYFKSVGAGDGDERDTCRFRHADDRSRSDAAFATKNEFSIPKMLKPSACALASV